MMLGASKATIPIFVKPWACLTWCIVGKNIFTSSFQAGEGYPPLISDCGDVRFTRAAAARDGILDRVINPSFHDLSFDFLFTLLRCFEAALDFFRAFLVKRYADKLPFFFGAGFRRAGGRDWWAFMHSPIVRLVPADNIFLHTAFSFL